MRMRNLWKRAAAAGLAVSMVLQGIPASTVIAGTAELAGEETVTEVTAERVGVASESSYDEKITVVQSLEDSSDDVVDSGTCGDDLIWVLDNEGMLTISGVGEMTTYSTSSTAPWYGQDIYNIVIETGVSSIGDYAFYNCSSLTSVTIPDSVTEIGASAFRNCSSLTSMTIPDSVTEIGTSAFYNCSSLTSVTIPDSVTEIESSVFSGCTSLASVTIPNSVTEIGSSAFYNCSSLTSVTIPDSVTKIGSYAFRNCSSLTSMKIPDSVTTIGSGRFTVVAA